MTTSIGACEWCGEAATYRVPRRAPDEADVIPAPDLLLCAACKGGHDAIAAGLAALAVQEEPRCRVCGCTEDNACLTLPGGATGLRLVPCRWVEPDKCSGCHYGITVHVCAPEPGQGQPPAPPPDVPDSSAYAPGDLLGPMPSDGYLCLLPDSDDLCCGRDWDDDGNPVPGCYCYGPDHYARFGPEARKGDTGCK